MTNAWLSVLLGTAMAILITTTMDATGYSIFSALPLLPLFLLFWWWQRFSRIEVGFKWGGSSFYGIAIGYPVLVMSILAAIALGSGAVDIAGADWNKTLLNLLLMTLSTVLVTIATEEGFFRGWLWAALKRAGQSDVQVLLWTSIAFTAWHVSAIALDTGFDVPAAEIPVYLVNATLLGLIWGMLRALSGSIVVSSVSHALWNGLDYPLFGFGEKVGALGIRQTHIYGPEVGLLGIVLNLLFAVALYQVLKGARGGTSN